MRPANRGQKYPPQILTRAEIRKLLAQAKKRPSGAREYALLRTIWRSGLRSAEVLALRASDVDPWRPALRVVQGKGGAGRVVGIDLGTWRILRWRVRTLGLHNGDLLFPSATGRRLDTSHLRRLLPRLARAAGLDVRAHAHALRHSLAVELSEEGMDLRVIARQLGHRRASTTSTYLDHLRGPDEVIDAMGGRR